MYRTVAARCEQRRALEPLGITKRLFGLDQRTWHTSAWLLAKYQNNARWNTVFHSPLCILFITMVSFMEDHSVPAYISRWPQHSHLLHLNPGRGNSTMSKISPINKLLKEKTHKPTIFGVFISCRYYGSKQREL